MFVTHEVVNVGTGAKSGGNDPVETYLCVTGIDPLAALTVETV